MCWPFVSTIQPQQFFNLSFPFIAEQNTIYLFGLAQYVPQQIHTHAQVKKSDEIKRKTAIKLN